MKAPRPQADPPPAWIDPIEETARRLYGVTGLYPIQRFVIANTLEGCSQIVVLPTGAGKSLCWQVPLASLAGPDAGGRAPAGPARRPAPQAGGRLCCGGGSAGRHGRARAAGVAGRAALGAGAGCVLDARVPGHRLGAAAPRAGVDRPPRGRRGPLRVRVGLDLQARLPRAGALRAPRPAAGDHGLHGHRLGPRGRGHQGRPVRRRVAAPRARRRRQAGHLLPCGAVARGRARHRGHCWPAAAEPRWSSGPRGARSRRWPAACAGAWPGGRCASTMPASRGRSEPPSRPGSSRRRRRFSWPPRPTASASTSPTSARWCTRAPLRRWRRTCRSRGARAATAPQPRPSSCSRCARPGRARQRRRPSGPAKKRSSATPGPGPRPAGGSSSCACSGSRRRPARAATCAAAAPRPRPRACDGSWSTWGATGAAATIRETAIALTGRRRGRAVLPGWDLDDVLSALSALIATGYLRCTRGPLWRHRLTMGPTCRSAGRSTRPSTDPPGRHGGRRGFRGVPVL